MLATRAVPRHVGPVARLARRVRRFRVGATPVVAMLMSLVVTAAAACTQQVDEFEYLRLQVDGQPMLAITKKGLFIRGVVVYFHGSDENEFALTADAARRAMTKELTDAGFAVVASQAGGNAFGDPATLHNYLELGSMARQHYRIENLYFLAEAAGAIPAINLLTMGYTPVRGLAALSPELSLPTNPAAVPSQAELPAPGEVIVRDPMTMPVDSLKDRRMRLYVHEGDGPTGPATEARAFEQRFGAAADVSIVTCSSESAQDSCIRSDDVIKWFTQLG